MKNYDKVPLDACEREYVAAIAAAAGRGDNDEAQHLSVGLAEYRELFKVDHPERVWL